MSKTRITQLLAATLAGAILTACNKSEPAKATPSSGGTPDKPTTAMAAPAAASTPAKSETFELKVKWSAGRKVVVHVDQTQDSEGTVPGLPDAIKTSTKVGNDYSLTAVAPNSDGGWELALKLLGQKIDSKMGDTTTMSFDSKTSASNDSGNPIALMLRKAVDAQFKCQTDAQGKALKVEGVPDFMKRLTGGGDAQSVMTVKSLFSEDSLKEMFSLGQALPDHPVKPGDSWSGKQELEAGPVGKLTINLNYTLKGKEKHGERDALAIDCSGAIVNTPGSAQNGVEVKVENGVMKGTVWFDLEAGIPVDIDTQYDMNLKLSVLSQEMNTKVSGTTRMKLRAD